MKYIYVLFLSLVAVVCVIGQGFPTKKCPPGEHSVLYCPRQAEPDCDIPTAHDGPTTEFGACDIPDCFCDSPTVRDLRTGKCVRKEQCPKNVTE